MRTQQLLAFSGLMLASNVAVASKLDHDDVPNRCWNVCGDVVGISKSCDARYDNDSAEIKCICDWEKAKTQIPLCSACITQYQTDRRNNGTNTNDNDHDHDHDNDDDDHDDDDDDNEALDLVHSCSLTTTTYNSAATTASGSSTSTGTGTAASASATTTDSSSPSGTSSQDSTTSSGSGSAAGSASSSTSTPGAAVDLAAPGAIYMTGIMGLMAFAWL
ncbi:uncharacterized protein N7529_010897 [Penicillium soppii]|uniref:uncharacterized protein n=1 Tax=Penicillium soppii TaxID=69789 RepID=UPI0025475B60|nr:uncharacterized protein N7529_010897 [Penicillium soppii]KAJ5851512.1 hypothetical protein N7529_010897 [Penicillium soppii]